MVFSAPFCYTSYVNHQGRILLLYGQTLPREFITSSLVWLLLRPSILYFVDGANAFDGYGLIRYIVRQGHNPRVILKRIHISRTFTCYQLMERISSLPPFPPSNGRGERGVTRHALYVLGLLDTFYDEQVPLPEVS